MFSAHWITEGETRINTTKKPEILYDMYGFPEALYKTHYDVLGSPERAYEIIDMLGAKYSILGDENHGIDHGVWSTLIHAFPDAYIPVIQMSLDGMKSPR
jgi:4,5-DOPA dioxygenase extradiol